VCAGGSRSSSFSGGRSSGRGGPGHRWYFVNHQRLDAFRRSLLWSHTNTRNTGDRLLSGGDQTGPTIESRGAKGVVLERITHGPGLAGISRISALSPKFTHFFHWLGLVIGPLDHRIDEVLIASSGLVVWPIATARRASAGKPGRMHIRYPDLDSADPWAAAAGGAPATLRRVGRRGRASGRCPPDRGSLRVGSASMTASGAGYMSLVTGVADELPSARSGSRPR